MRAPGYTTSRTGCSKCQMGELRRESEEKLSSLVPEWLLPCAKGAGEAAQAAYAGTSFLSLFGGVAEPARAFDRGGGTTVILDVAYSRHNDLSKLSKYDLSKLSKWNQILRVAASFDVVRIDLPCNTWSRARRAPNGSHFLWLSSCDPPMSQTWSAWLP